MGISVRCSVKIDMIIGGRTKAHNNIHGCVLCARRALHEVSGSL